MRLKEKTIYSLDTPRVIIDYDKMMGNIHMIHDYAFKYGVKVRPHIKTHKNLDIARIQKKEGAIGVTASKPEEASIFMHGNLGSITVAYPVIEHNKVQKIISTAKTYKQELNVIIDSEVGLKMVDKLSRGLTPPLGIYVKIDVGFHRCGLSPDDPLILDLIEAILSRKHLSFKGLLSYSGHAYRAKNHIEVEKIALEEINIMKQLKFLLEQQGIEINELSIGSTPTLLTGIDLTGITEIRPGNYIFLDRTTWQLGLITPEQIALNVIATIISKNKNYFIIDAGSKILTSDLGPHGSKLLEDYGIAYPIDSYLENSREMRIVSLSEEHGIIKRPSFDLPIGTKLRIIPNHACPIVNLVDSIIIHQNEVVIYTWKVHARGKIL